MSLSVNDRRVNAAIDLCLFYRGVESTGGTLYVQGWIYDKRRASTPVDVAVSGTRDVRAWVRAEAERPDVLAAYPQAPLRCGFNAYIPVADERCLSSPIELAYRCPDGSDALGRVAAFDVDQLPDLPDLAERLTARQMTRVRNIVRNERERVNHARLLQSKPLYLIIDPSFGCQLRCPYCHGDMVREAGVTMPVMREEMVDAILERYGETLVQAHFFNWGEPLLNKRFPELVAKAHALDIWTTASTNFSLELSDEYLSRIIGCGLDLLIVSVDGTTQQTYEQYRRGGDLALVLGNIERLIARRRALGRDTPQLRFQFLDFPWTHAQIDEARAISERLGADVFHVKGGCIHPRQPIVHLVRRRESGATMGPDLQRHLAKLQRERAERFEYFGCDHLYHQLSINSDGSVHPCCYVYEPGHTVGQAIDDECFDGEPMRSNRAVFSSLDERVVRGHQPCVNCWIVGDAEARGHKESTITFQSAFEMVVKQPIADFVPMRPRSSSEAIATVVLRRIAARLRCAAPRVDVAARSGSSRI